MRISQAWCAELSDVVDVAQAQSAYFAQRGVRRSYSFRCPDAACRAAGAARVVAVGLEQLFADEDAYVPPHFAIPADGGHLPDCPVLMQAAASAEAVLVRPLASVPGAGGTMRMGAVQRAIDEFHGGDELVSATAEGAMRTRTLRALVERYLELGAVERARARVRLGSGEPLSYASFFRPLARLDTALPTPVSFGGARVRFVEAGYALAFYDRVTLRGTRCELTLSIDKDALAQAAAGPVLREALMLAAGPDCHARVFFHGRIDADPLAPRSAVVRLRSLDDVVVMPARAKEAGMPLHSRMPLPAGLSRISASA